MNSLRDEFLPSTPLQWLSVIVLAGVAALIVGLGVIQLGLFDVAADTGEMEGVANIIHHAMQRSVARGAASVGEPPDLARADLSEAGAAQYRAECSHCHGAPGAGPDRWTEGLNPKPPTLAETAPGYSDKELYWIVRHGVRMTAMPPWPSGGPHDEIWAMVAFLRKLPGLDPAGYAGLLASPGATKPAADAPQLISDVLPRCTGCHGADGKGRTSGAFPRLDLQPAEYIARSLTAFSDKHRISGMMQTAAAGLTKDQIDSLAKYFAGKSQASTPPQAAPARAVQGGAPVTPVADQRGKAIVESGIPAQHIAPCRSCHDLPAATGTAAEMPSLSGQYWVYLAKRLTSWQRGDAADSGTYEAMDAISHRLEPSDIEAVARYYGGLPGSQRSAEPQR